MWKLLTNPLAGLIGTGLSFVLAISLVATLLAKNSTISGLENDLRDEKDANVILRQDNTTLLANARTLEGSLKQCNDGLTALKTTTDAITSAGVKALQEVQKAGKSVDRKVAEIDAMPTATCEDAFKILKAQ